MKTICVITGIIIVISLIVAVCIYAVKNNSSIPLLIAENGAEWIRYPDQTILKARLPSAWKHIFLQASIWQGHR